MPRLVCNLLGEGNIWARNNNDEARFAVMYHPEKCWHEGGFLIRSEFFNEFNYFKVKWIFFRGKHNKVVRINYSRDMPKKIVDKDGTEYTWLDVKLSKNVVSKEQLF